MKRIILLIHVISFLTGSSLLALNEVAGWEETLRVNLNTLLGDGGYSFETLTIDPSGKTMQGTGTFFNVQGVDFTINYDSVKQSTFFEGIMPPNARVAVKKNEISFLTSQEVKDLIPEAVKKALYLEKFDFTYSKKDQEISELNLSFDALTSWELLEFSKLSLQNIHTILQVLHPSDSKNRITQGRIEGTTAIGGKSVMLSAKLTAKKEDLEFSTHVGNLKLLEGLKSIVGDIELGGLSVPDKVFDLELSESTISLSPYKDMVHFYAPSNLGIVDGYIQKNKNSKGKEKNYEYLITISPDENFKLSNLDEKLKVLDMVDFSNQKIVLSSTQKTGKEAEGTPFADKVRSGFNKGCSMVANIDLTRIKLDHLIGVKNLILSSPLTAKLNEVTLQGAIDTEIAIGPAATLSEVIFRLKPAPNDFAISLLGVMKTRIGDDDLDFKGGVEIVLTDQTLNFLAMMQGEWTDPLGARGLSLADVGIQLGASFTTAPLLLPNVALSGKMKIGKFSGEAVVAFDTRNPAKSMLAANYNKIVLWDFVDMVISKKVSKKVPKGMKKTLESFYSENVELEVVPFPVEVLGKHYDAGFRLAGGISVSGLKGEAAFDVNYDTGIYASGAVDPIDLKIFKLKGANGQSRPGFSMELRKKKIPVMVVNGSVHLLGLEAETDVQLLDNGFQFMIGGKIFNLFKGEVEASGQDLTKAGEMGLQVKLDNDFSTYLEKGVIKFIEESTSNAVAALSEAQSRIFEAQKNVEQLDKEIKKVRKIVAEDQAKDLKKINKAQTNVKNAQKQVNTINKKIASLKKKRDALKKHQVVKKSAINSEIAVLFTSRVTANTALNSAKLVLKGFEKLNVNPDADSRMIALRASQKTAIGTLQAAKAALEGVKKTLGIAGKVGVFIVDKGTDALIRVRKADFGGKLGTIDGGAVNLNLDLEWMKKKHKITVDFNFKDMAKSVVNVGKELMKK
jgi:hypothetical protein